MADLQVVFLQDIVPVSRVEPLDTLSIPSLRITGKGFLSAQSVLINGIETPEFVIINNNTIAVEIPPVIVGDLIRSVAVLSGTKAATDRSVLVFRLAGQSGRVRGTLRMVQRYTTMILTNPGSDLFNLEQGGGLRNLVGRAGTTSGQRANMRGAVQQSVSKAARDLKKIESTSDALQDSERLVSATLTNLQFDPRTTTLAIRVHLVSSAGTVGVANIFT